MGVGRPVLADPSRHTAYMREWRARNPAYVQRVRELNAERAKDPEYAEMNRRRARDWHGANKERANERTRQWERANAEATKPRRRESTRRYRALARGARVGPIDYPALVSAAGGRCALCRGLLGDAWQYDHIVPISKGGPHTQENLQVTHPSCNRRKSNLLDWQDRFPARGPEDYK